MFDVLMFLFENYMNGNVKLKNDNNDIIVTELERIGFQRFEIDRALHWLEGLSHAQETIPACLLSSNAIRHYLPEEALRLGQKGQGFLLQLEQLKIIDPMTREIVIDRIMALNPHEVHLRGIRWVVLMVLYSQPEKQSALNLLQDMILADAFDVLH